MSSQRGMLLKLISATSLTLPLLTLSLSPPPPAPDEGFLPKDVGLAKLGRGVVSRQNVTASPSLTAVSHIAIATGSTAVHNDIPSNTFEAIVAPLTSRLSGFAAPIGGYHDRPLGPSPQPTASPLWVQLRQQGKNVITAT